MTDHLADARACIQSATQAPDAGTTISWLTETCEQIIAHLEAQQTEASLRRGLADITAGRTVDLGTFAQPATAPPAAQQGDSGQGGGGEAARPNLNAQTGYTPTTEDVEFCFVGEYDPEMRSRAFHRWLAAHDREVRAQALREAADKIHVSLQRAHKRDGRPLDPMFHQHDQGLWEGYKNAENWLRARAEHIGRGK